MIISPEQAYLYAVEYFPHFHNNWYITPHFKWSEVFVNEKREYGCPSLAIFLAAYNTALEFEKVRIYLGNSMNVHCWFRSMLHNINLKEVQHLNPAMHSSHLYAMAVDFHVTGLTIIEARNKILEGVKEGVLHVRVEPNTSSWIHIDTGNIYINNYRWGLINM